MTGEDWRPSASRETLQARAHFLSQIRAFFAQNGVLEVETPILSAAAATDPHLDSFVTRYTGPLAALGRPLYLHTSPEFAMKRLLAADSGPIYQICKVFRNGEAGRLHNPEFTMLEWYRPGFDSEALMDEVDSLLSQLLDVPPAERVTYQQVFEQYVGIDPHRCDSASLRTYAKQHDLSPPGLEDSDRNGWLDLLLTHCIEPNLGQGRPTFLCDYPASQASLARLKQRNGIVVAERFELYIEGIEIANGYYELAEASEQRRRMEFDQSVRAQLKLPQVPMDQRLLAALEHGFPVCAGIAVGVDRLFMLTRQENLLTKVMAFPISIA